MALCLNTLCSPWLTLHINKLKQMRRIKLYIASSLNGKIARPNGSVEWLEKLPNPDKTDHGYAEFSDSIDTTIQGGKTYRQIISWDIEFPYIGKTNYVLTRNQNMENNGHVEIITENPIEFFQDLKKQDGKDIWLIGGGQLNTLFLNSGLIDEIRIFIMPIILPNGIELFEMLPEEKFLHLKATKEYSSGAVELVYGIT